jgi:hypothetical protein
MEKHLFSLLHTPFGVMMRHSKFTTGLRLFFAGVLTVVSMNNSLYAQCQTCCNGSKPKSLVFKYTGGSCSSSRTCQADGKWSCSGGGANAGNVYIVVSKNSDGSGGTYFAGTVNLNAEFTANSASGGSSTFPSNTYINIYSSQGGSSLQRLQVHTSCSTPLVAGDQFGALFLQKITLADNTNCNAPTPPPPPETCPVPVITVNNTTPTNVGQLCKGDQITFKTTDLGYPCISYSWNFGSNATPATASGIGPHTVTYSAAGSVTVSLSIDNNCENGTGNTVCPSTTGGGGGGSGGSDCCDANSGKPKSLTLQYTGQGCSSTSTSQSGDKYSCSDSGGGPNGDQQVFIIANEKADGTGITYFSGNVNLGATFTATAPSSSLPTNTYFIVYASQGGTPLQQLKIHTSCSAPIVPGDQFGSLKLLAATWSTGVTCGNVTPPGPTCLDCDKTVTAILNIQDCTPVIGKIGDFVWVDTNGNGIQDPGEPGLPGVFVMLMTCSGTFVNSTTTDANGMYMFNNLPAGSYKVFVANPNGSLYTITQRNIGDDAKDSDIGNDGFTDCINLAAGQTNLTVDAGFKPFNVPSCNLNIGVTNILCDGKGTSSTADDTYTFVLTVTGTGTGSTWQGSFNNACLGVFQIGPTAYNTPITLGPFPAGSGSCGNTFPPITYQNGLDISVSVSDVSNPSCTKNTTVVSPGPCSPGATATLGDFVWNDLNQNGTQDFGEPGVAGVTVNIYKCNEATPMASVVTGQNGFYQSPPLASNMEYFVEFVKPAGFTFTPANAAADNVDSDANTSTGRTACTFLSPGENDNTLDAGVFQSSPVLGSIGDFVWNDLNRNGVQDPGEPGFANITVRLRNCNNAVLAVATTNNAGAYSFPNLAAGCYRVSIDDLPTGFVLSPQGGTTDITKDSDINPSTRTSGDINLAQGQNNPTIDAGLNEAPLQPGSIGDFVWNDQNQNGVQDPGEPGFINVTVQLKNCNDQVIATTTTNGSGFYNFPNLNAGCYRVTVINPNGYSFSPQNLGDDTKDSDVNPSTGTTGDINLAQGQNNPTNDAGIYLTPQPTGSIGDFVWDDQDKDGVQDPGEPGFPNVTVQLKNCNDQVIATTTTNGSGFYNFPNLNAGCYRVTVINPNGYTFSPQNLGDDTKDSDVNPSTGTTGDINLAQGQNNPTNDAGIYLTPQPTGSIGDFVWDDQDKDGVQDPGEPGRPGVTVRLLDCNGNVISTTTTNASGNYSFANLPGGNYIVEFSNLPAGYQFSPKNQGGNNSTDSDANPTTGRTDCFSLAPGQNDPTKDAGIFPPTVQTASVGDFVWNDQNSNGVQDPGEPGVQGVLVKLFTCTGTFVGQFTTNSTGFYQFTNLPAGSYFVQFSNLPTGTSFTSRDATADDSKDSDPDPATGNTACFNLAAGQNDPTRDAGLKPTGGTGPATLGDFVWFDPNQNGIQDPGEPGIPNVFVILETCSGVFVNYATTNAQGQYLITNVQPGQYRIKFANPGTYNGASIQLTTQNAGADDAKDSDADWLGFTGCFTVNPGENNLTYDAGFRGEGQPPVCTLNGAVSGITCNNNGTPNNPGDDTYTFTLIVNGSNTGAWGYDIPALGLYTLQFGQPYNLGPFNISAGTLTLQINDHDVNGCTTTVTVQPPAPCSSGTSCTATAGTLFPTQNPFNLQNGIAVISATHGQQPFVPSGFQKIYVLTKGTGLVIQSTSSTPSFTVTSTGLYTIHTLVYDPATLNLGIVVPGQTTGFQVNALLIQGGGTICGALDVTGAPINVQQPTTCNNVTNSGTIGYDETSCQPFNPANIESLTLPSGGSGTLEYIWLSSTQGCPDNLSQTIPGATGPTYDPPSTISQTTWYVRCARRVGCIEWIESNCVKKEVCSTGGGGCNVTFTTGSGSITIGGLTAANKIVKVFNPQWVKVFECGAGCTNPTVVSNLPAGTYYVDVQQYNASWQPVCNKADYVTISSFSSNTGSTNLVVSPSNGDDSDMPAATDVSDRNKEPESMISTILPQAINLYPNPANNYVMLDLTSLSGKEVQIDLHDNLGRNVRHIDLDEVQTPLHRIELDGLREGHYVVWVKTPGHKPFVKQFIVAKR